jgi:undecaprenyl-diphosphatase
MSILSAIILGLVQGITEFIPVSSSGHLVIFSHLLNVGDAFTFDVLLNFGTLLALIIYYRKRLWSIIKRVFSGKEWSLVLKVIVATIPAVILGLLLSDKIDALNNTVPVVVATLIIVGVLMIVFGKANPEADNREIEQSVSWSSSNKIGLSQAVALIPGVSRSGITILAGLRCNLSAAKAAEYSFLLAIPIIVGASFKMLLSHAGLAFVHSNLLAVVIGNLVSFTAGMLAINFFIKLLSRRGLKDFGWYRVALAAVLIILMAAGVL